MKVKLNISKHKKKLGGIGLVEFQVYSIFYNLSMYSRMIVLFIFLILTKSIHIAAQDECQPRSCSDSEPIIRFPFRLTGIQPEHCGYPGFSLFCNPINNNTEFDFQFPVRASARNIVLPISARARVWQISYLLQAIDVDVLNGSCLPNRVPEINTTASPFQPTYDSGFGFSLNWTTYGYTLFNCSGSTDESYADRVTCFENDGFGVYACRSSSLFQCASLTNCVKMYNISDYSLLLLNSASSDDTPYLRWSEPNCSSCEARGMYCRLRTNGSNETECVEIPGQTIQPSNRGVSRNVVILSVVGGFVLMVLMVAAIYRVYIMENRKRRMKQFVDDYKDRRPSRYTYAEVKMITNGFTQKLGQGGFGTVYKGKLSNDIFVAVKVLIASNGNDGDFISEVGTIGNIHHVNVVRLVGYCADGKKRALVYEFLENDSLEKYIASRNHARSIGWEKIHQIAIGIAKGLDYLHQGCNQRILHFDIKPQNILLDHDLNPKVADFGLAKLCSKDKSVVTMTAARGTIGYIAPEVFSRNFGKVSYKSDIYSFGMLLLDMVGGRNSFGAGDSEAYFPEEMYNQLEKGGDLTIIQIDKGEESDIVKRMIIVGLWCIQWYPAGRPSTKGAIQMLEGENLPIMPPNPFDSSDTTSTKATLSEISIFSNETISSAQTSMTTSSF